MRLAISQGVIMINKIKYAFIFLGLTCFSSAVLAMNFNDYLQSIPEGNPGTHPSEYTFNPSLLPLPGDYSQYQVSNVILLFDTSGSTAFSSDRGGRRGGGSRRGSVVTPPQQAVDPQKPQTKHIALAQLEGLSLALKYLAQTSTSAAPGNARLYLVGFSGNAQRPIAEELSFPALISSSAQFEAIAHRLPQIMPRPEFGSTSLGKGLEEVLKAEIDPGPTLMIVVTDGQTSDASQTAELVNQLSLKVAGSEVPGFRFDVITIGAGSIALDSLDGGSRRQSVSTFSERAGRFSSAAASSNSSQCNRAYLEGLTAFASALGKGKYSGAYQDYSDLNQALHFFFSGKDDGSHALFIQSDTPGLLWRAQSHQYVFVDEFIRYGIPGTPYTFDKLGYQATIEQDPTTKLIRVTDVRGKQRYYLWEKASHLKATTSPAGSTTVKVTSDVTEIQNLINTYF